MVKRVRSTKTPTTDSFANLGARVGFATGNPSDTSTYGFNPISRNHTLLEWMYRGSWLCGVGVDCVADDMTREGVEFTQAIDAKAAEKLQAAIRRKQIWQSLNQVSKWARLYGGALGLIVIDGQDPATPLRLETVAKDQFVGITAMDRWMLQPDFTTGILHAGPDFGLPQFYTVTAASFSFPMPVSQRVHHSRVVRMEGVELPYWQKVAENMWGLSVLERVWDRLVSFDSSTMGFSQLAYRAYLRSLKVKGLRDIVASGGKKLDGLVNMLNHVRQWQVNEGLTVIDADDEMDTYEYSFAGASDVLAALGDQVSGALQIPQVRLFGQAPSGMSTDDKSALHTYYDNVKRQQERWFRRPCDIVFRVLAASEAITIPEGFEYDFISLWQMTEEEKANINDRNTAAVGAAVETIGLRKATALRELQVGGRKTGYWGNITEEDIKEAEEIDALPSPQELMVQQAESGPGTAANENEGEEGAGGKSPLPGPSLKLSSDAAHIVDFANLAIHIETPKGQTRRGNGWETVMPADYGFIHGFDSAEGPLEELDCFIGPDLASRKVFVIDQCNPHTGAFDEHKVMLGFKSAADARKIYTKAFSDGLGAKRIMALTPISLDELAVWLSGGERNLPFTEQWE